MARKKTEAGEPEPDEPEVVASQGQVAPPTVEPEAEPVAPPGAVPPPAPQAEQAGKMKVRKGRYIGRSVRSFQSVPFGEQLIVRPGEEVVVRSAFEYLWTDPNQSASWEWAGPVEYVTAVNEGQVAPPA